jgi:hypothetical protein
MSWQRLERKDNDPNFVADPRLAAIKASQGIPDSDEVWMNDLYQVTVDYMVSDLPDAPQGRDGMLHLSIHTHSRDPVRQWRHLQAIKNEVAGEDRSAVEIFPREDHLVDTSNEYHLWVLPTGVDLPFAWKDRFVSSDRQAEDYNAAREAGHHKGKQEPWEEGITTGGDRSEDDPRLDPLLDQYKDMDKPADPQKLTPARASKLKGLIGE